MTVDQFVILTLLGEQDGITQQELARRASSDPNTIRAMLVLLENRHLVARVQHPTDGRALRITLTCNSHGNADSICPDINEPGTAGG